jgi:uncharacterized membrane protein
MVLIEHNLTINRSKEEVFGFVTNLENLARWQPGIMESKQLILGPTQIGTKLAIVRQLMGQRIEGMAEVTELKPNQAFALKMIAGPMSMRVALSFEPAGDNTNIRIVGEMDPHGFFKVAEPLVAAQIKSQMETSLNNMKVLLENPN